MVNITQKQKVANSSNLIVQLRGAQKPGFYQNQLAGNAALLILYFANFSKKSPIFFFFFF